MRNVVARLMALGFAIAASTTQAEELTSEQIKLYAATAGYVLSAQKLVEQVSGACGSSAPHLAAIWNERNAAAVERAKSLRALVQQEVVKTSGPQAAAAFAKKQDAYLAEKVSAFIREIGALTEQDKGSFCKHFLGSTKNGKRDIVLPEPVKLVQIPLEETEIVVEVTASSNGWRYTLTHKEAAIENIEQEIYLPSGKAIRFVVQSADVIHSMQFWGTEQESIDAIPGIKSERNLTFDESGAIVVGCGESHPESDKDLMKIYVVEQNRFAEWIRNVR